jgi:molecular chaperone GrpE
MSDEQGETVESTDADEGTPGGSDGSAGRNPGEGTDADGAAAGTSVDGAAAEQVEDGDVETDADGAAAEPVDDIAARVEDGDAETIATEIAGLRERVADLEDDLAEAEAERDDLEDRLKRKAAEFQNYKKRQEKRREEIRERATEDLVEELLEVRDNLDRALDQEEGTDIREGVEATFRQLDEILSAENVEPIEPAPGSEVDPARHEVLLNVDSDQPAGTVAGLQRPGYEMAGKVLRPAQVTVADGEPE